MKNKLSFRFLPPTATPISIGEIWNGIIASFGQKGNVAGFEKEICRYFKIKHSFLVSSGRAALTMLFKAMRNLRPDKDEITLPAYTSFSVSSAAIKAGLRVSLYDTDPHTLSPDIKSLERAITRSTLCIVVCHLYGYPADMDAIMAIAKEKDLYIIDDAAQTMGAKYKGKFTGTFGDAGIFSLNRGKNMTTSEGGIIVTDSDPIAKEITAIKLKKVCLIDRVVLLLKLLTLSIFTNPHIYWLTNYLPFLKLGESLFSTDFDIKEFTDLQAAIGLSMLKRLEDLNKTRVINADKLVNSLKSNNKVRFIKKIEGAEPVFLRLPVLCERLSRFERLSLGVVKSYPHPISEIEQLKPYFTNADEEFLGAKILCENLLTLPTHTYLCSSDIRLITNLFK